METTKMTDNFFDDIEKEIRGVYLENYYRDLI
jgi:hypothetical protein